MIICRRCGEPLGDHIDMTVRNRCAKVKTDRRQIRETQHKVVARIQQDRQPKKTVH